MQTIFCRYWKLITIDILVTNNDMSCPEDKFDAHAEALAAIKDVCFGINSLLITTCRTLQPPPSNAVQYLNLRSFEGHDYCIRITTGGFQV